MPHDVSFGPQKPFRWPSDPIAELAEPLDALLAARQEMIDIVIGNMPADRRMLVSPARSTRDRRRLR